MCMVSGDVKDIKNTRIFTSKINLNAQLTVYSNTIDTVKKRLPSAMILPIPNKLIKVIDMTNVKDFFTKIDYLFDEPTLGFSLNNNSGSRSLKVYRSGSYRYSVVKSFADFNKLNTLFDLDLKCIDYVKKHYSYDFEFLVCILDSDSEYIPIGYIHENTSDKLFIPTRHYHTHPNRNFEPHNLGEFHAFNSQINAPSSTDEHWDHEIYVIQPQVKYYKTMINYNHHPLEQSPNNLDKKIQEFGKGLIKWNDLKKISITGLQKNDDLYAFC